MCVVKRRDTELGITEKTGGLFSLCAIFSIFRFLCVFSSNTLFLSFSLLSSNQNHLIPRLSKSKRKETQQRRRRERRRQRRRRQRRRRTLDNNNNNNNNNKYYVSATTKEETRRKKRMAGENVLPPPPSTSTLLNTTGGVENNNNNNNNNTNKTSKDVIKYIELGDETYNVHDVVSMKAPEGEKPYIAKILRFDVHADEKEKKKADKNNEDKKETDEEIENRADKINVHVSWYYRPEESASGRKAFHGEHEVFASDHTDWVKASTIESKIHVYTLADYQELQSVNEKSFFSRFAYKAATSEFKPDHVQVFCKCSMPYNPDLFMVECGECKEWFHPECIGTSREDLDKNLKNSDSEWFCDECVRTHKRPKIT